MWCHPFCSSKHRVVHLTSQGRANSRPRGLAASQPRDHVYGLQGSRQWYSICLPTNTQRHGCGNLRNRSRIFTTLLTKYNLRQQQSNQNQRAYIQQKIKPSRSHLSHLHRVVLNANRNRVRGEKKSRTLITSGSNDCVLIIIHRCSRRSCCPVTNRGRWKC